jgi:hypothetical protein
MIGKIDDLALRMSIDGGVRLVDEAFQPFRQPMVAAGLFARAVHSLLHNDPFGVVGDDEAVQIQIKTVLHRGAVDLGHQATRLSQNRSIETDAVPDRNELLRRLARMLAAAATDMNSELGAARREPALERTDDAGRDARRMPVHAHHSPERLEPERMGEPAQQFVATVVMNDGLADDGAETGHPIRKPARHLAAVQRKISVSSPSSHFGRSRSFLWRAE